MEFTPADYYYNDIRRCLQAEAYDIRRRCSMAYRLFVELVNETTADAPASFSGAFSRLHYLHAQLGFSSALYHAANDFRVRWRRADEASLDELTARLPGDLRALADLVACLKQAPVPAELAALLPEHLTTAMPKGTLSEKCWRVVVNQVLAHALLVSPTDLYDDTEYHLPLTPDATGGRDFTYLLTLVEPNTQLNLVALRRENDHLFPELIIVEPDYLVSVTAVAQCIRPTGTRSAWHVLKKFDPFVASEATLLGNLSGQMLDEEVHGLHADYIDTARRFFADHALDFASCPIDRQSFHQNAQAQQRNLRRLSQTTFKHQLHLSDEEGVCIEPSFFCEMLGLQGRIDLMKPDGTVVVEQKSGKFDEYNNTAHHEHEIQLMLYMAMRHYAFQQPYSRLQGYLLYSKYPDEKSIWPIPNAPDRLREAFRIRNEIVAREMEFARNGMREFIEQLSPEDLHQPGKAEPLWNRYIRPQVELLLAPFHTADATALAYFYRFHRFLVRENLLSRFGSSEKEASGFAAAWQCTTAEKREVGSILTDLRLLSTEADKEHHGVKHLHLALPTADENEEPAAPPNFRAGDIVVLYRYETAREPDLRRDMVFRATVSQLLEDEIVVTLREAQTDPKVFSLREGQSWAIEPDFMDAGTQSFYRGLYDLLTGPTDRRAWVLGQRQPAFDASAELLTLPENEELTELVRKAKAARDLFLLVGPPGTGKTSKGLMSLLREELAEPTAQVLLGAFTNRAVDEICGKLVEAHIDFVRVGNEMNCAPAYRPYLLDAQTRALKQLDEVKQLVQNVRVVVGTTLSLSSAVTKMTGKHFSLAIIDEASQLLEPHLLPLIMAHTDGRPLIDRFVLIGDHRQLPAVVQQPAAESLVTEPELRAMGVTDCRRSFFERFIERIPEPCRHDFTRQGRMHPEVADFPSRKFYEGKLCPIPLAHQEATISLPRVAFYDCTPDALELGHSPKGNPAEARLIARLSVEEYERFAAQNGRFDPRKDLGIIVPYRRQIALVRNALLQSAHPELADVTIDTVERFQGSECNTIIYGFTVSRASQLAFLCGTQFEDECGQWVDRKLNVVLTRARERMLIVGHRPLLERVPLFGELIDFCESGQ